MSRLLDITGRRFGKLIATVRGENHKGGYAQWWFQCDCGSPPMLRRSNSVMTGNTTSCGCSMRERTAALQRTHGMSKHKAYLSYKSARTRCTNQNQPAWKYYGGKGIKFLLPTFPEFWSLMEASWFEGATLDRIDYDGHYEIGNVRWVTKKAQASNKSDNHRITFNGESLLITEWAKRLGIHQKNLLYRIRKWPLERALTTPKLERKNVTHN